MQAVSFEGGDCDVSEFIARHSNSMTPTTLGKRALSGRKRRRLNEKYQRRLRLIHDEVMAKAGVILDGIKYVALTPTVQALLLDLNWAEITEIRIR